jgi:hypothetical protein
MDRAACTLVLKRSQLRLLCAKGNGWLPAPQATQNSNKNQLQARVLKTRGLAGAKGGPEPQSVSVCTKTFIKVIFVR